MTPRLIFAGILLSGLSYLLPIPASAQDIQNRLAELERRLAAVEAQLGPGVIELFDRYSTGVVRVESGLAHGTGFFIEHPDTKDRLILTNDHVLQPGQPLSITLDSVTRVPSQIVARDPDADLALLRIHPGVCPHCQVLRLPPLNDSLLPITAGERVIAVGYPLHQSSTVTSGIVSSIRQSAIVSDVALNAGNSGGPLLNMSGIVIAVNTFIDQSDVGPGIAGSVAIHRASHLIGAASETTSLTPPPHQLLPTLPINPYPMTALQSKADSILDDRRLSEDYVDYFEPVSAGPFWIRVVTPLRIFVHRREIERRIFEKRQEREAGAGIPEGERLAEVAPFRDWMQYVGFPNTPAVTIRTTPGTRSLGCGYSGDVQEVYLLRDGKRVDPVRAGMTLRRSTCDMVFEGINVYAPAVFEPSLLNTPPRITVGIRDLKRNGDQDYHDLPPSVVARLWNDFVPYYAAIEPDRPTVIADSVPRWYAGRMTELPGVGLATATRAAHEALESLNLEVQWTTTIDQRQVTWLTTGTTGEELRLTLRQESRSELYMAVLTSRTDWEDSLTSILQSRLRR